ncbi:hypothetical protein GCM10027294_54090 [Marinactinospora endophytica]
MGTVHTAPSRWPEEVTPWHLEAVAADLCEWVRDEVAWYRLAKLLAHARRPGHIPMGNLNL